MTTKLGYRKCTGADCDHQVHYRSKECPSCGAVQIRGPEAKAPDPVRSEVGTMESAAPQTNPPDQRGAEGPGPAIVTGPYVVAADCRPQIDNVMAVLRRGQIVEDYSTIQKLLAAGAPIVPENQAHGLACCPRCQNIFAPAPFVAPQGRRRAG